MSHVVPASLELPLPLGSASSNTQRTLSHSRSAVEAYAHWEPLWKEVQALLGTRAALIYAYEISRNSHCQVCTATFRRGLAEQGLDPDALSLRPEEELLVSLARAAGHFADPVHPDMWTRLRNRFSEKDLVNLVAFAGLLVATNLFNNLVSVPVDEDLQPYALEGDLVQLDFAWETL